MNKQLLSTLRCPQSQASLMYIKSTKELVSIDAQLAYPVKQGIPVLMVEEARKLSTEELEKLTT